MERDVASHGRTDWLRSRSQEEHPQYHIHTDDTEHEGHDPTSNSEYQALTPQTTHPTPERESSARTLIDPLTHERRSIRRRNTLEREQSRPQERRRRESEGEEGSLTELAAPDPVDRSYTRRDSFEVGEREARRRRKSGQWQDDDAFLTEVAAPAPIDEENRSTSGDEENNAGSKSPPAPSTEKEPGDKIPRSSAAAATRLYTISYLILFSILGTLARLGIEAITRYPQAPFPSVVLWANVGGSLFMGFLAEDRRLFREEWGTNSTKWSFHMSKSDPSDAGVVQEADANHGKVKKTIPLFIGLATGFCGSFTSFSSFIRDVFLALTNDLASPSTTSPFNTTSHPAPRNGGYSFEATVAILIVQVSCSICAFHFGAHLALLLDPVFPTLPFKSIRRFLDPLGVFLAFGCWLGAILLSIFPLENFWRGRATFSLVFAPLGCLLRFYVSKQLNARIPSFPLGTFLVNIFGTAILGMCYDLQHTHSIGAAPGGSLAACQVLDGVMEGFCGCTTTVSAWVMELTSLRRRHAYIYGIASMAIALGLLVVIMGSVGWTRGFGSLVCSV